MEFGFTDETTAVRKLELMPSTYRLN